MATIPQTEFCNNINEILRRVEVGEHFTITVSGRPVARLYPVRRQWVPSAHLADLWATPPDPTLDKDLAIRARTGPYPELAGLAEYACRLPSEAG
jgi:prevent-host-death family protein